MAETRQNSRSKPLSGLLRVSCAIVAITCAATDGLRAQTPAPPGPPRNSISAQRFVIIGCVSRETETAAPGRGPATGRQFLLTDTRSDPPSVYRLDGDETVLTFHIGHTVEIAGPLTLGPGAGSDAPGIAP